MTTENREEVMSTQATRVVAFEHFVNLVGELMFKCEECGVLVTSDTADGHAIAIHNANFMSIINVPISDALFEDDTVEKE